METKAATPTRKIAPNDLDTRYLIQPELIGKGSFSKVCVLFFRSADRTM